MVDEVYMYLNGEAASTMCQIDPSYLEFMDEKGRILVKLLKALYGCVQSAYLWYECLKSAIIEFGFQVSTADKCVFTLGEGQQKTIVAIYVDDLMVTGPDDRIVKNFFEHLKRKFKNITINDGVIQSYLGMSFDFTVPKQVTISMKSYIQNLIKECNINDLATSPASSNILSQAGAPINQMTKEKLQSDVAKLLYLAIRVRQDIQFAVNHLCTRVNMYDESDVKKYQRVIAYLANTIDEHLVLKASSIDPIPIKLYVDASFAIHTDAKSHSGIVISLGCGSIYSKSTKQKMVTKSSTEAELVAASNSIPVAFFIRDIIQSLGYTTQIQLFQDNTSTIRLITNGESTSMRTKHINVKYFHLKEKVDNNEIQLSHLPTELMIADIHTKPLQGNLLKKLKFALLNCGD